MSGGNFIEDLVAATKRHGVTCVVLSGNGTAASVVGVVDPDDEEVVVPPVFTAPVVGGDPAELEKLRAQVQKLSAELQEAQTRPAAAGAPTAAAQVPAGDYGSADALSTETLGFEDVELTKKLMRLGYETIGKLRTGFGDAKLAEHGLKKDWLIEVGMKLAGAPPSSSAASAVAAPGGAAGGTVATDVPAGHTDRPWLERLSLARAKQTDLDTLRAELVEKQAEAAKYTKKKAEIPETLDDSMVEIEDNISLVESQLVAMRWCMGLDPEKGLSLDEALQRANLGPWMANPKPRLSP